MDMDLQIKYAALNYRLHPFKRPCGLDCFSAAVVTLLQSNPSAALAEQVRRHESCRIRMRQKTCSTYSFPPSNGPVISWGWKLQYWTKRSKCPPLSCKLQVIGPPGFISWTAGTLNLWACCVSAQVNRGFTSQERFVDDHVPSVRTPRVSLFSLASRILKV